MGSSTFNFQGRPCNIPRASLRRGYKEYWCTSRTVQLVNRLYQDTDGVPQWPKHKPKGLSSGHKRFHCLTYQSVTTPDGLILNMYGPEVGRRHEITLYRQINMDAVLSSGLNFIGFHNCIYGDPAYMLRPWMQVAFTSTVDKLLTVAI